MKRIRRTFSCLGLLMALAAVPGMSAMAADETNTMSETAQISQADSVPIIDSSTDSSSEEELSLKIDPSSEADSLSKTDIPSEAELSDEAVPLSEGDDTPSSSWKCNSTGFWYEYADGSYPRSCWKFLPDETGQGEYWYYFNSKGYRCTGWQLLKNKWYYMDENGKMLSDSEISLKGKIYLLTADGSMFTGWNKVEDSWYFYDRSSGEKKTGWIKDSGKWYLLDEYVMLSSQWVDYNSEKCYLNDNGSMAVGWKSLDGNWYYFNKSGYMQKAAWVDTNYYVDADGIMVNYAYIKNGGKYYWVNESGKYTQTYYYFDKYYYNYEQSTGRICYVPYSDKDEDRSRSGGDSAPGVIYSAHTGNGGWLESVRDYKNAVDPCRGLVMDGINIELENMPFEGGIDYSVYVSGKGWQAISSGSGTTISLNPSGTIEAVRIELTGEASEHYDIYYRVCIQNIGWLNWACNGENAGTSGFGYRAESIRIALVEKGSEPPSASGKAYAAKGTDVPKVLFVGNSYIWDPKIHEKVKSLIGASVYPLCYPDAYVTEYINPGNERGKALSQLLNSKHWDYVVVQNHSKSALKNAAVFDSSMNSICNMIKNAGAVPVLFSTWADYQSNRSSYESITGTIDKAYSKAAATNDALIAHVGYAFQSNSNTAGLYLPDHQHPSSTGGNLAAKTIAREIIRDYLTNNQTL